MRNGRTAKLERHFQPFDHLPCWGVHWEPQVNLSMNFGTPHLEIREPKQSTAGSARVRRQFAHRLVTVRGQWWLWLFWSRWTLSVRGLGPVRSTGSADRIRQALRLLDGQRLTKTVIASTHGKTRFEFDLGAILDVRQLDRTTDAAVWSLYKPDGRVLSVRGDGFFSLGPGNTTRQYQRIAAARSEAG
jgi:hypothetical protein